MSVGRSEPVGRRVLYLTYDGLTDPLGQSQVLPYLKRLSALGHAITIISCEKAEARKVRGEAVAAECRNSGIDWRPLRYRKRPPIISTVIDLVEMLQTAVRLQHEAGFDLVHCRSYLPALIGRALQRRTGLRFIFDMRGFWIDERLERGIWPRHRLAYKVVAAWLRRKEQDLFASSDAVVSLTEAARNELARRGGPSWARKTCVIPCCVDLAHFEPRAGAARTAGRALLGLNGSAPVLLYLGSVGGAYPLGPVLRFFRSWADGRDDARLLFITRDQSGPILDHADAAGLSDRLIFRAGERAEMPTLVAAADVGVSFILPSFCAIASSPTKLGEMLAMGLAVAANSQVGDVGLIMKEPAAGVLLPDLSDAAVEVGAAKMRSHMTQTQAARRVAVRWFALDRGVEIYDSLYRSLDKL